MRLLSFGGSYFTSYVSSSTCVLRKGRPAFAGHILNRTEAIRGDGRPLLRRLMVCGVPFRATEYLQHKSARNALFYHLLRPCHLFSAHNTNVIGNK